MVPPVVRIADPRPETTPLRRRLVRPPAWVLPALLVACADTPAPATQTPDTQQPEAAALVAQVTDSAGITIRTTPAASLEQPAYRPSATPALYLDGTADGGAPLHSIGALGFTPAGQIAIAERGEMAVRIHGADGRRIRTVGREGQGPGEFGALNGLGFRGDSILVFDSRWFRISVFDGQGVYARQIEPTGDWGTRHRWVSLAPGVGILTRSQRRGEDLRWGLHDFAGNPLRALPELPGSPPPKLTILGPSNAHDGPAPPFKVHHARSGAGPFHDGFAAFLGEFYEVQIYDGDGGLSEIWRVDNRRGRPVTDDDVDAARRRALATVDDDRRPGLERRWTEVVVPKHFPALGSGSGFVYTAPPEMIESAADELWVHGYPTDPESPRIWWVFDATGTLQGSVAFPARFELHAVGESGALGIELDDFDVERVALYRLELAR